MPASTSLNHQKLEEPGNQASFIVRRAHLLFFLVSSILTPSFLCLVPLKSHAVTDLIPRFDQRGTSRRVYHHRPWLSDISQLGGAPCQFRALAT
jgi:hypothetical protein